jgi:hypothetical protein
MKLEQSELARTGRVAIWFEPVPVRARRQLSAAQARCSSTAAAARPAKRTNGANFMAENQMRRGQRRVRGETRPFVGACERHSNGMSLPDVAFSCTVFTYNHTSATRVWSDALRPGSAATPADGPGGQFSNSYGRILTCSALILVSRAVRPIAAVGRGSSGP